jgi:hypothetical protein
MKKILLLSVLLLAPLTSAHAQSIYCPPAEEGMTFTGPKYKTEISGRSKATCRYYYKSKLKATIEVYFYRDYERQRPCSSGVYFDADIRSWEYQVYGFITDNDKKDFLTETYWEETALGLLRQAEEWALPCDAQGRKIIRRPVDVREE